MKFRAQSPAARGFLLSSPWKQATVQLPSQCAVFLTRRTHTVGNRNTSSGTQYVQIPEHIKIHMFVPELEIIRHDELRAPFRKFLGEFILKLLELRANEIRLGAKNSNPESRLNNDNVVRIMKVSSRLRQLFDLNGGNTEVLDAMLQSQSVFDAFESKVAAKKHTPIVKDGSSGAKTRLRVHGPYVETPESLALHDYAQELHSFRTHGLKSSYAEILAQLLLDSMELKLTEIGIQSGRGARSQEITHGISQKNCARYFILLSKLQRLFACNGGNTAILDMLLQSHNVFELGNKGAEPAKCTDMPASTRAPTREGTENAPYKQVPDDVFLEEYCMELSEVKDKLGSPFAAASMSEILQAVSELAKEHALSGTGLIYSKLYRNLVVLFKHNGGETSILDTVLVSAAVFERLEDELDMSPEPAMLKAPQGSQNIYRGMDHVLDLLNKASMPRENCTNLFENEERTIQSALAQAMSKEEKSVFNTDPLEYEEIVNLTSDKIRRTYRQTSDAGNLKQVQRNEIEKYLKQIKHNKQTADENKWREQTAFEWSSSLYKNHRSFEARNFFNPIWPPKSVSFPMFPGTGEEQEYLILTSNGQRFHTQRNPLGMNHVPEDMFAILQTLSEDDLAKFLRQVEKLRKKGWRLIGSGHTQGMLVLSRELTRRGFGLGKLIKFISISCAFCFAALLSANWLVEDQAIDRHLDEADPDCESSGNDGLRNISEDLKRQDLTEQAAPKSRWQRLFWA
ncbi:hypothetical protein METBIDRAFT_152444 [Metschnikowia bicuspidata var. bicuspidata NRRL YB-4993]|uniref:Uncharacterized protein n=1 Tax=Metschnikowia bicuspidata var. bicuspidata NRRL YB-4993 TaxID=869754 RepID=A0A1A0HEM5_9ASCO|nr:hypothetical protein METBIDRAFT_152444 [Metschnikowia bicuspidata var. bicuspidata NRRL YB-4993]OBA22363.1 hypothetical protein METBIDRAFT_152444 [Metschnikowia bicuspidata var. bicuspidata NRRL YB-4993]